MILRYHQSETAQRPHEPGRLNLLLSYGGWRETPTVEHLARLLEPHGINCFRAESGEEATDLIRQIAIHIAIVDLAIPLRRAAVRPPVAKPPVTPATASAAGGRILQLLRRLEEPPPTVIVRPPQPATRESVRGLSEALREGAFAVVDRPVHLETMLEILRRILRRHYADHWPDCPSSG